MLQAPEYIADGLTTLAVPIDNLTPLPGNYRRHDIEKIKGSLRRFKQRKALTAQRTGVDAHGFGIGVVTAGNGTWQAAKELGWTHIAATFQDDSDAEALSWAITDNRSHDLGSDDPALLLAALQRIEDDEALLLTTGYSPSDLVALADSVTEKRPEPEIEPQEGGGAPQRAPGNPVVSYQIIFDSEEQQQVWFKFVRWLKRTVDGDTVAARMTSFLDGILEGYDE